MSLIGALQLSSNALQANQIALQVVSQNISNANTPGYSRAEVEFQAAPTQKFGGVLLGLGVQVGGVVQRIDTYLEERLRNSSSDRASSETQEASYQELESVLNVLSDNSLSSTFNKFFSAVNEVLNQPESVSNRNLAILQGRSLSQDIRNLASRVTQLRNGLNDQVKGTLSDANRLIEEVRRLNVRITALEGGSISKSDAVGLRDQRNLALTQLSELVGITVTEDASNVNINIGGEFVVFEGTARTLIASTTVENGQQITDVQFSDTKASITRNGGKLAGLYPAATISWASFKRSSTISRRLLPSSSTSCTHVARGSRVTRRSRPSMPSPTSEHRSSQPGCHSRPSAAVSMFS